MKRRLFFRRLSAAMLLSVAGVVCCLADDGVTSITLSEPGTLASRISGYDVMKACSREAQEGINQEYAKMKISGNMNGDDFEVIRNLFYRGSANLSALYNGGNKTVLDLSDARIVAGGQYRYPSVMTLSYQSPTAYISPASAGRHSACKDDEIGDYMLSCLSIDSLVLPRTVKAVGRGAFECSYFGSLTMPQALQTVKAFAFSKFATGKSAFGYGPSDTFKLPSVSNIERPLSVYYGLNNTSFFETPKVKIDSAYLRSSYVTTDYLETDTIVIANDVHLADLDKLNYGSYYEVEDGNPDFAAIGGVLYTKGLKTLLRYPGDDETVRIGGETEEIADYVFYNKSSLKRVVIDAPVRKIGYGAFALSKLEAIDLGDSIKEIGEYAFYHTPLASADFPQGLERIGNGAFRITQVSAVNLPGETKFVGSHAFSADSIVSFSAAALEEIGAYAFAGANGAEFRPELPNSLRKIGEGAFYRSGLAGNLNIPSSVEAIGDYAFASCGSLNGIYADGGSASFSSADGVLFDKGDTTLLCYPAGKDGSAYAVPSGVSVLGNGAFYSTKLSRLALPSSLKSVGDYQFGTTSIPEELATVYSLATTPPVCTDKSFIGVGTTCTLLTPTGTSALYKEATGWKEFQIDETNVTAINGAKQGTPKEVARYTADGIKIARPQSGVNIVVLDNGEVRKELVK